jgi:hypothetical protein
MAFKTKTKNRFLVEERQTLDAKHNNILSLFTENRRCLPNLETQLEELTQQINNLRKENEKTLILDLNIQKEIWKLDDEKTELEKQIKDIKNNNDETNYMLNTSKILSNYYKILEQEKQIAASTEIYQTNGEPTPQTTIVPTSNDDKINGIGVNNSVNNGVNIGNGKKKSIMDWFSQTEINKIAFENIDTSKKKFIIQKKTNKAKGKKSPQTTLPINTHIDVDIDNNISTDKPIKKTIMNKDTIYEKYMKIVDKNYININNDDVDVFDTCLMCHVEMLLNNNSGILICPNCGLMENIIIDSDKPSFKEPPKEMTSFCYKRINHLNEFLAQFQAKETTDIHEDVYNEILVEIKKERITNMALITPEKMRALLKKIGKNDYYEHIPYIINQLNGLPAPVIAPEIEEIIRGMFKAIQIPFEKYCPHKRKNFLSYNYVMYKFFELLELDEYLHCFQLLKSRTKLHQQDLIWKNICYDLNWQFIKSL